ncbi:right-handed parallel beta-helix repeat-containing protein [Actinoplanes sp. NPDC051633]|uniref:right-handed parallel beta-helix repeat-containing protein n=1 Tax=Actinoplanes sp. NPDC051633 TaxID=3155670 RepID=UPI00341EC6DE
MNALVLAATLPLLLPTPTAAFSPGPPTADVVAGARAEPDTAFVAHAKSTCDVYLAENGVDSGDGRDPSRAWATLRFAVPRLTKGMVACLAPGDYNDAEAVTAASGDADEPIVIRGTPGATRLHLNATKSALWFNHAYWIAEGLDFDLAHRVVSGVVIAAAANHVVFRNSRVHDGAGGAGVYVAGDDVAVETNEIGDNFRYDATGALDDAHGVAVVAKASRVRIAGNRLYNNSGDGMQCEYTGAATDADAPIDIIVRDNRFWTDPAHYGQVEQGVDIKGCRYVSIAGSVSPQTDDPNAANQKFYGFSNVTGGRGGGAMVVHVGARNVLVANNRVWNSCFGINVGYHNRTWPDTESVVIRRNVFFDLNSGDKCGNAIFTQRVQHVDIHHNTIDRIPGSAVSFGTSNESPESKIGDFDVFDNIVRDAGRFVDLNTATVSSFSSDRNIFYGTTGSQDRFRLNGSSRSLSAWQAAGHDPNSRVINPEFVSGAGTTDDYYTEPGSPARGTASDGTDIGFRQTW